MTTQIKLTIAYDGANYVGWQRQDNGISVQEVIEKAIGKVTGETVALKGAGRTDAGVHAYGQVACFTTESDIVPDCFHYHLKVHLPEDISVFKSEEVPLDFHPRFDAVSKTYRYELVNAPWIHPIYRQYKGYAQRPLNLDHIVEAAGAFVGTHDFTGFMGAKSQVHTTVRTITSIDVEKVEDTILFTFRGNGFLRNMIRIIVGTLVLVGMGRIAPDRVPELIQAKNRKLAGPTFSPSGLYLMAVHYEKEIL